MSDQSLSYTSELVYIYNYLSSSTVTTALVLLVALTIACRHKPDRMHAIARSAIHPVPSRIFACRIILLASNLKFMGNLGPVGARQALA